MREIVSPSGSPLRDNVSGVRLGEGERSPLRLSVSGETPLEPLQVSSEETRPRDEVERYVTCFSIASTWRRRKKRW